MTPEDKSPVDYWWPFPELELKREDWDRYAKGYRLAATLMIRDLIENPSEVDVLVFPLVHSYLHYLELRLKELIATTSELNCKSCQIPHTHNLMELWKQVRSRLKGQPLKVDERELSQVDYLLEQAQALDPFATDWRYPQNRKGEPSAKGLIAVNPADLQQHLSGVGDYLDGFSMSAAYELSTRKGQEARRE